MNTLTVHYGPAQFKLDISCVTQELFNKFVEALTSYTQAHNKIS